MIQQVRVLKCFAVDSSFRLLEAFSKYQKTLAKQEELDLSGRLGVLLASVDELRERLESTVQRQERDFQVKIWCTYCMCKKLNVPLTTYYNSFQLSESNTLLEDNLFNRFPPCSDPPPGLLPPRDLRDPAAARRPERLRARLRAGGPRPLEGSQGRAEAADRRRRRPRPRTSQPHHGARRVPEHQRQGRYKKGEKERRILTNRKFYLNMFEIFSFRSR